jgi:ketosteroid isomerase-like protein
MDAAMSQSDVAALRDAYEAFSRGEFDVASRILASDIEWVENGKGMPYSGTWHGPESVVNDVWTVFAQYWGGPGVVGLEADQFLDAGDHIVVTGRFTGRDSEGRTLDAPCAHVWRMSNGAAARFANYTDWTV